jgi:hypothetical protein
VEALAALDPARLADGESLLGLLRQVERLEAGVTRAMAAFDAGRTWEADGARSAAAWLATRARLPAGECRRQVQTARQLRHLPLVEEAWRAGRFEADWAEARARLGDRASANDVVRTAAQRRADALVELVRRAEAMPADAKVPEPLFTVLVGYETFAGRICELANGSVVTWAVSSAGSTRRGWSGSCSTLPIA